MKELKETLQKLEQKAELIIKSKGYSFFGFGTQEDVLIIKDGELFWAHLESDYDSSHVSSDLTPITYEELEANEEELIEIFRKKEKEKKKLEAIKLLEVKKSWEMMERRKYEELKAKYEK